MVKDVRRCSARQALICVFNPHRSRDVLFYVTVSIFLVLFKVLK